MKNGQWLVAALLVGLAGGAGAQETAIPALRGPEFGYQTTQVVRSFYVLGGETQVTTVIPPNAKVLEGYARDVTAPEALRLKAVDTIATLSQNDAAVARLERIAVKMPRKSSSASSMKVAAAAISGLGESTLPRAKTALERIKTGNGTAFEKHAAAAALLKLAQKIEDERPGYW